MSRRESLEGSRNKTHDVLTVFVSCLYTMDRVLPNILVPVTHIQLKGTKRISVLFLFKCSCLVLGFSPLSSISSLAQILFSVLSSLTLNPSLFFSFPPFFATTSISIHSSASGSTFFPSSLYISLIFLPSFSSILWLVTLFAEKKCYLV